MVRKLFPLFLLCVVVFSGCAGFSSFVSSPFAALPSWVNNPQSGLGKTAFVGKGEDSNEFNARLAAKNDILSQISAVVGEDVSSRYYREFTTSDSIQAIGLSITREYRSETASYLMVECSTAKLDANRTDVMEAKSAEDKKIAALLEKANAEYRKNHDVQAIRYNLDALYEISTKDSSYQSGEIVDKVVKYLNAIRFRIMKSDSENCSCTIRMTRKQGMFSPKVEKGAVSATFSARNSLGETRQESFSCNTQESGSFDFTYPGKGMENQGSVLFSVDIKEKMAALKNVIPQSDWERIDQAVNESAIIFSYARKSPYFGREIIVNVKEYSLQGQILNREGGLQKVRDFLEERGVKVVVDSDDTRESDELVAILREKYPAGKYLLYATFGTTEEVNAGDIPLTIVTGQAQLWDLPDEKKIADTEEVRSVKESSEDAFSFLYDAVLLLLAEYL